jgi:hypothetical protein
MIFIRLKKSGMTRRRCAGRMTGRGYLQSAAAFGRRAAVTGMQDAIH